MPTLEPIVNTSPREKAVPEFNEKEVVEIVNKGISSGQVAIPTPESGTKLYKHDIYISSSESSLGFSVISNSNTSATTKTAIDFQVGTDVLAISPEIEGDNWLFAPYRLYFDNNVLHAILCDGSPNIETNIDYTGVELTITDTITEL